MKFVAMLAALFCAVIAVGFASDVIPSDRVGADLNTLVLGWGFSGLAFVILASLVPDR